MRDARGVCESRHSTDVCMLVSPFKLKGRRSAAIEKLGLDSGPDRVWLEISRAVEAFGINHSFPVHHD